MCFQYIPFVSQQRSYSNALTTQESNAILLTCSPSAPLLLYPSLSLWVSEIVSLLSTKQIVFPLLLPKPDSAFWAWLRPGFIQKTQLPLLRSLMNSPSLKLCCRQHFGKTPTHLWPLHLTYILLPPSHQHLYQLPLDETLVPFHPHIFPL